MLWPARLLTLLAAALLGLGLVAPCMTITPGFGDYDTLVRLLHPEYTVPSTYSVLTGILTLLRQDNAPLGLLLLAFSAVFPTVKLAIMAGATQKLSEGRPAGWWMTLAHHTGKFSMLDVLVLALLVLAIKGLPGGSRVTLGWGVWAFAGSVTLSLVLSGLLHVAESRHKAAGGRQKDAEAMPA